MSEVSLSPQTKSDIDKRVLRILEELGNPSPPIQHEMIRELLKLDLHYFKQDDPGIISEVISRLKRMGKQIMLRPSLLWDMIRDKSLRAAYIPDVKRIYVDEELHHLKKRWGETHECVHDLLPWHREYLLGDNDHTLTQTCRDILEAEANYGTGRLLFAGNRFNQELADLPCSRETISKMSKTYKNSLTSTLWRIVESINTFPVFGYICPNDSYGANDVTISLDSDIHLVKSPIFEKLFFQNEQQIDRIVRKHLRKYAKYYAGEGEEYLSDINGTEHLFRFEIINNRYCYLTLGSCPKWFSTFSVEEVVNL